MERTENIKKIESKFSNMNKRKKVCKYNVKIT